jgi:hypothetical protein
MSGYTSQEVEDSVDIELRRIYKKEREQRLREGKNRREGGFGGT